MEYLEKVIQEAKETIEKFEVIARDDDTIVIRLSSGESVTLSLSPKNDDIEVWDKFLETGDMSLVHIAFNRIHKDSLETEEGTLDTNSVNDDITIWSLGADSLAEKHGVSAEEIQLVSMFAKEYFKKKYAKK